MRIFPLVFAFIAGGSGLYLGLRVIKKFQSMTLVKTPLLELILNSIMAGGAGSLIFFTITIIMGLLDKTYVWNMEKILGAILISLVPGGIIVIGSFIQAIGIIGYRRILFEDLKRKDRNK